VEGLGSPTTELGEVVICGERLGKDPEVLGGPRSGELGLPSLEISWLGTFRLWWPELKLGGGLLDMLSTIGFESLELELEFISKFPEVPRLGGELPSLGKLPSLVNLWLGTLGTLTCGGILLDVLSIDDFGRLKLE